FRVRNGNGCDPAPMTTGKLGLGIGASGFGPIRFPRTQAMSKNETQPAHVAGLRRHLNILQTVVFPASRSRSVSACMLRKIIYGQASRLISIGKLNASPRLHTRPIDLVIFQEPLEALRPGRSHLVEGFTLRCLQRFSLPDVATRR